MVISCLISNITAASSLSINVYLKFKPDNQVTSLIRDFNWFLQQNGLIQRFHISPFLDKHPLHITLYLANYEERQIPLIMKKVHSLAGRQKPVPIVTGQFQASSNGYVMLSVKDNKQLEQLSNTALNNLSRLRDKTASIPRWAAQDKERIKVFSQWGSPNVFQYFHPHFSIFDPDPLSKKQRTVLYTKLQHLISQFSESHHTNANATAYAIGMGLADSKGQIVTELGSFKLTNAG